MTTRASRATSASFVVEGPGIGSARSKRRRSSRWQKYCARNSSGRQTMFAPSRAASRMCRTADGKIGLGIGPHAHLHQADVVFALCLPFVGSVPSSRSALPSRCSKANPGRRDWPRSSAARDAYSSRISTAAAIVVVQRPRLSPTADCVTLLVRTILLEMR